MTTQLELFGIKAEINIINMGVGLGVLKELSFNCNEDVCKMIIQEGVKRGFPFERTSNGVKLFN
jgi:hypothetical protein